MKKVTLKPTKEKSLLRKHPWLFSGAIKKIDDNTSSKVEILVHLPSGISPDKTIDALYAFTNCEVSISPLSCIIENNKPCFLGVSEILIKSTDNTVNILKKELEIRLMELEDQWHNFSLERIFIENKIYRNIEKEETYRITNYTGTKINNFLYCKSQINDFNNYNEELNFLDKASYDNMK